MLKKMLLIINDAISHSDSPMAEQREEGVQNASQVPVIFLPLPPLA